MFKQAKLAKKIVKITGITAFMSLLLCAAVSFAVSVPTGNLLSNPGFETWSSGMPSHWIKYNSGTAVSESTTAHSGKYAAKIGTTNTTATAAGLNDGTTPNITSTITGVTYSASCWVRDSAATTIDIQLHELTQSGGSVKAAAIGSLKPSSTSNWYQDTVSDTASKSGDKLPFSIYDPSTTKSGATFLVDDCTLTAKDTTAPTVPTALTASAASPTQVNLNWTASSDNIAVAGYDVLRGNTIIGTTTSTAYTDTTATAGTPYVYSVKAFDAAGNTSMAATADVTTPYYAPSAPTNLTATAVSTTQVNIAWAAAVPNSGTISGYTISRSVNGSTPTVLESVSGATLSYSDTSASAGTTYSYIVTATNSEGLTSPAATVSGTTLPAAPVLSTVSPAKTAVLSWTAVNGATDYVIYRGGAQLAEVDTNTYTDPAPNGTYGYTVAAVDAGGIGAQSGIVSVLVDNIPPTISYSLSPAPNASGWNSGPVTVSFTCTDNAGGSGVASCSAPVTLNTTGANQTVTGTAIDYAGNSSSVTATVNIDTGAPAISATLSPAPNASGWNNGPVTITYTCSDSVSGIATCPNPVIFTNVGSGQQVSAVATNNAGTSSAITTTLNIDESAPTIGTPAWSANPVAVGSTANVSVPVSSGLSSVIGGEYFIGTTDPGAGFGTPMTLTSGMLSATLGSGLSPGSYLVNVRAENAAGNWSPITAVTLVISDQAPTAPTNLTATAVSQTQLDLAWTAANPGNGTITNYQISRSENGGSPSVLATVPGTTTAYTDSTVNAGTSYSYTVTAADQYGVDGPASSSAGDTPPAAGTPYSLTDWDTALSAVVHADVTQSTPTTLPNGQILWIFGDTTSVNGVSTVGGYGYPHDSFVEQVPGTLEFSAVPGPYGYGWQQVPNWSDGTFFWMSTDAIENGTLYVFGERIQATSTSFSVVGNYVAEFNASTLAYESIQPVPSPMPSDATGMTMWSGIAATTGGWIVTGGHSVSCSYATDCTVGDFAFVPSGDLGNESDWQVTTDVVPSSYNTSGMSLDMVSPTEWVGFTKKGGEYGGTSVEELDGTYTNGVWTVSGIVGNWAAPSPSGTVTYGANAQLDQAAPPGEMLVSYDVNGGSSADYHALFEYLPLQ